MTKPCAACGLDVYDGDQLCPICRADPPPEYGQNGQNGDVGASTGKERTNLQQAALAAIDKHGGVVAAARALGCNHGVISLAAGGEDFPKARKVLGLPPKAVPVEPCPDCGQLHEQKTTCPQELEKQRQGPKPHRRAAYFGAGEEGRQLAERWDEMAERWGGMTGLARGILDGRYIVEEAGE